MKKKIARYITPLVVIFLGTLLFAAKLYFMDGEEGQSQYLALMLFLLISFPALLANGIINWLTVNRKPRRISRAVASLILVALLGVFVWRFFF